VVTNLLNNAAKYSEQGGQIRLSIERENGQAVVSVRDTGIGIASEHLPHIFDMFAQVDRSLDRAQGGLGVGLALVRGLTALHGGSVEARSEGPGKGSEFIVRLPIVEAAEEAAPVPRGQGEPPCASQCRILVVDDNRDSADSMSLMLRHLGHDVRAAYDGAEAEQAADTFRPDAVLLDIGLPKRNGYEVARHIRRQPWGAAVLLIAVTGWGQEEDRRKAAEAGFDHHLTKPVNPAELRRLLATLTPRQ
jgi:CheY-like chemotaxis protein